MERYKKVGEKQNTQRDSEDYERKKMKMKFHKLKIVVRY